MSKYPIILGRDVERKGKSLIQSIIDANCPVVQIRNRNPRAIQAMGKETQESTPLLLQLKKDTGIHIYVHAPYLYSFVKHNPKVFNALIEDLKWGDEFNCDGIIVHSGSAKKKEDMSSLLHNLQEISKVMYAENIKTKVLIEILAGDGNKVPSTFEELSFLVDNLPARHFGVCLDTQHIFSSGEWDLTKKENVKAMFEDCDRRKYDIKLIHLNDSNIACGGEHDIHAEIGDGLLAETIPYVVKCASKRGIPMVLENKGKHISFEQQYKNSIRSEQVRLL